MATPLIVPVTAMVVAIEGRFVQQGIAKALQLEDVLIALARTDVGPNALTMLQECCDDLGIYPSSNECLIWGRGTSHC